jgi:hypothetical protein
MSFGRYSLAVAPLLLCLIGFVDGQTVSVEAETPATQLSVMNPYDIFVKLRLDNSIKLSKLHRGDRVNGAVTQPVYVGSREVLHEGSRVGLEVDHLERRHRTPNDHWPWVIQAFTPRHENVPIFRSADVPFPGGEISLDVSFISIENEKDIHAQEKKKTHGKSTAKSATGSPNSVVTFEATLPSDNSGNVSTFIETSAPVTLAAGTEAKIILLTDISASHNQPGDPIHARILQPVLVNSKVVLPAGALLEGKVVRSRRPRILSRAGSLFVAFTGLKLPGIAAAPVEATITQATIDDRSHTRIDAEGEFHGERPGKAWMAINAGVTAGIAKEVDDGLQLVIEAIVSTATDASTAGTARIAATCASGLFILTRHGRDVVLPRFTELTVVFDRPVTLAPTHP